MTVFTLGETHCANCSRLILPGEEFAHGAGDFTHSPECPIAVSDIHQQLLDVLNDYHRAEYNADSGTVVSLLPYADRLERLISQTVSSVIGEDEPKYQEGLWTGYSRTHANRNLLRAEQRQALERLLGSDV